MSDAERRALERRDAAGDLDVREPLRQAMARAGEPDPFVRLAGAIRAYARKRADADLARALRFPRLFGMGRTEGYLRRYLEQGGQPIIFLDGDYVDGLHPPFAAHPTRTVRLTAGQDPGVMTPEQVRQAIEGMAVSLSSRGRIERQQDGTELVILDSVSEHARIPGPPRDLSLSPTSHLWRLTNPGSLSAHPAT